jgi:hypothetical protein
MKTNGTLVNFFSMLVVGSLVSFSVAAQPDYVFKNATLVSGTDKKVGAKYLFKKVKTGVDAFVTITKIDKVKLAQLDGPSGFDEAFQPYIDCPAKTKGYVEFKFDFVVTGTVVPALMPEVPVTAIDIDGYVFPDEKVYEFDEFDLPLSYFIRWDLIGSALNVNISGTTVKALNKTAVDYAGIDTVKKDVMFTMVYNAVTSITIRAGVDNKSTSDVQRLRSDYFKKFDYPGSMLAKSSLVSFRGNEKNNKVNLQWELAAGNLLQKVIIEKATTANQFEAIGEAWTNVDAHGQNVCSYHDPVAISNQANYRLKMIAVNGEVTYSNILVFRSAQANTQPFNVYPSVIQSSTNLRITAAKTGHGQFQLVDYAGRVVMQQNINVQEGNNNIAVNNMSRLLAGNYVAVVKINNEVYNQKIVKQ